MLPVAVKAPLASTIGFTLLSSVPNGVEPKLLEAANRYALSNGRDIYPQDVIRTTRTPIWNVREYDNVASLTFFAGQLFDEWTCSLNNGVFDNNKLFLVEGLRFLFAPGIVTATGAAVASDGGASFVGSGTAADGYIPFDTAQEIINTLRTAIVEYSIGGTMIHRRRGLEAYVQGGAIVADVAAENVVASAGATTVAAANLRNGSGMAGDIYRFPPHVIVPQRQVRVDLKWESAFNLTTALPITCEIDGTQFELVNT